VASRGAMPSSFNHYIRDCTYSSYWTYRRHRHMGCCAPNGRDYLRRSCCSNSARLYNERPYCGTSHSTDFMVCLYVGQLKNIKGCDLINERPSLGVLSRLPNVRFCPKADIRFSLNESAFLEYCVSQRRKSWSSWLESVTNEHNLTFRCSETVIYDENPTLNIIIMV